MTPYDALQSRQISLPFILILTLSLTLYPTLLYSTLLYSTLLYSTLLCSALLLTHDLYLFQHTHTAVVVDEMRELERQLAERKIKLGDLSLELDIVNEKYALDMFSKSKDLPCLLYIYVYTCFTSDRYLT